MNIKDWVEEAIKLDPYIIHQKYLEQMSCRIKKDCVTLIKIRSWSIMEDGLKQHWIIHDCPKYCMSEIFLPPKTIIVTFNLIK
jgi:hypothetical protein